MIHTVPNVQQSGTHLPAYLVMMMVGKEIVRSYGITWLVGLKSFIVGHIVLVLCGV